MTGARLFREIMFEELPKKYNFTGNSFLI